MAGVLDEIKKILFRDVQDPVRNFILSDERKNNEVYSYQLKSIDMIISMLKDLDDTDDDEDIIAEIRSELSIIYVREIMDIFSSASVDIFEDDDRFSLILDDCIDYLQKHT